MTGNPQSAPFGSILSETMAIAWYRDGAWSPMDLCKTAPLQIHPAAHVLHYGSACMARHIERMRRSAQALILPEPDPALLASMVNSLIDRVRADVPEAPGALYLRPILFGTMANIGAAATPSNEACLVVLASPVWDYFAGGIRPLKILVEEHAQRCAPHLGMVKTGGNYAAAMGPTLAARKAFGIDQVLFCPGGEVQETGASNFLLIRPGHILTRSLDSSFLHGVTRDSLLSIARDLGFRIEERVFSVDEMMDWTRTGEAALSGTAAVLSGVGTLVRDGSEHKVADGQVGPETRRLRAALVAVQQGQAPDPHGWLTRV
jgi:branched-chain amino acid aminotransferase